MKKKHLYIALAAIAAATAGITGGNAMMCNCNRAYDSAMRRARGWQLGWYPLFSRVREDLMFQKGDKIEIFAFIFNRPIAGSWKICRNGVKEPFMKDMPIEIGPDHSLRMVVPDDKLTPGFYDIYFTATATGKSNFTGRATFGYCADEIPAVDTCPKDLAEFWKKAVKKLDKVPPKAERAAVREMSAEEIDAYNITEASIPERYDPKGVKHDKIKVFKIQFDAPYDSADGRRRYHGWLAMPAGEGPFPGLLVLPGMGNASLPIPAEHARHGYAALMLQIHGLEVDLPEEKYTLPNEAGYGGQGPRKKGLEDDYYYFVYQACAQAVRVLAAQPEVDGKRIGVCGGSQGAHLAVATAAIAPEIKASANVLCHWANWPMRLHIEELDKAKAHGLDKPVPPFDRKNELHNHMSYYDPMNLATLVTSPALMGLCLNDAPSPISTAYPVFKNLAAKEKELFLSVGTDHDLMFMIETEAFRWMDKHLGASK